ncbi:MAG: carbohydrate-binding domain-containing protein [Ruminococcaceae bacterium]|nr:carbohydrate-binding domain-containing protein [Oscillospiraceae bacterium]
MVNKKLIAIMLCLSLVAALCACSLTKPASKSNTGDDSTQSTTAESETKAETVSVESEEISFYDATDSKGNSLKLSPIYDKDGKTVVAAYIITAFDKDANPLDAKAYPLLNSVVAATSGEKSISLTENAEKQLIKIETYADASGNIIAIQDINDINKNNNKTEFIKLTKQTNDKGSVHYLLTNEVIEIKEEKGKKVAVENGKKTEVKKVDSSNKTVAKKTEKDTASTSEKKDIDKKQSTTKKGDSSGGDSSGGDSSGSQTAEEKTYMNIVLKKNGKASSSAPGVECNQNEVIINNPGDYKITSETDEWHGGIKVKLKNDEEAELRFEDVNISYNKGNIVQLIDESDNSDRSFIEAEATAGTVADDAIEELAERTSAPNVSLAFPTGTTSTFENTANVYTGVIYNEAKLTFKGNGKVNLKAAVNSNNVISSSKAITVKNVSMYLETAAAGVTSKLGGAKGIFSYGKVNLESGSLTINSNGDAIRCDEYNQIGGTANIISSACDGIDADDLISISGGTIKVKAYEKTSLKVRRVNNQDRLESYEAAGQSVASSFKKTCIREGKSDGFEINGGTVICESYKVSTPRKSKQKVIICKASKLVKGSAEESKKAVKWKIDGVASSENSSVKYFYSSSKVTQKNYKILADGNEKETTWKWADNVGVAKVVSSTTV